MIAKSKQVLLLWFEGFREACSLHRVVILCHRSRKLLLRTGQCFLLNGFIFLGRYNDIAKLRFESIEKSDLSSAESLRKGEAPVSLNMENAERPSGLGGVMIGIGEQVYVVGVIPYIEKILNFLLLSWMYAYYCYEYKWNFSGIPLQKRLEFFQSNWAFFAGFGSPCVLAIFFLSPLVSGALMAILFPLDQDLKNRLWPEKNVEVCGFREASNILCS